MSTWITVVSLTFPQHQILWYSKTILLHVLIIAEFYFNSQFWKYVNWWTMIIPITFDTNFFSLVNNLFCGTVWQRNPKIKKILKNWCWVNRGNHSNMWHLTGERGHLDSEYFVSYHDVCSWSMILKFCSPTVKKLAK